MSLYCAAALRKVVEKTIIPAFTGATGTNVEVVFEPTRMLLKRIEAGSRPEIFLGITGALDASLAQGDFELTSSKPVAKSGIGVAVPPNVNRPCIASVEGFVSVLTTARSVAYSRTGPSGVYFSGLLRQLGIAEQVNARSTIVDEGPAACALMDGRADVAIQQMCELLVVPGVTVIGHLPDAVQHFTEFSAILSHHASTDVQACSLFDFLSGTLAGRAYVSGGLQYP